MFRLIAIQHIAVNVGGANISHLTDQRIVSLGWGTPETHRPAYIIMMVADVLAPNSRQLISNHHNDSKFTSSYLRGTRITHEAYRVFKHFSYWRVHPLTLITAYVISHRNHPKSAAPGLRVCILWTLHRNNGWTNVLLNTSCQHFLSTKTHFNTERVKMYSIISIELKFCKGVA